MEGGEVGVATLGSGAARRRQHPGYEPATEAIAVGRTPARVFECGEPLTDERRRPSDRPLERATVERGRLRRGRPLEQSGGAGGVGSCSPLLLLHALFWTALPPLLNDPRVLLPWPPAAPWRLLRRLSS